MAADIIIAILAAAMVAYTIYRLFFSKRTEAAAETAPNAQAV